MAATLSLLANLASIASLVVGDIPAASENIRKLSKSYGPGGHLGQLIIELAFIHQNITENASLMETPVFNKLLGRYRDLDERSEEAQAAWEAASIKQRFRTRSQTRRAHKELRDDAVVLGALVRKTSKVAQTNQAIRRAGTDIPSAPNSNLHISHEIEQDISTASLISFPIPTHSSDFMETWTTSPVDIGAQNPFADGVSVQ
ncbi:hypothetical protein C8R43DRAFT_1015209 [Mycena crocata]|nr:hypothetical protein C8R43DRAFT_1015209 [Mycena crocata]